MVKKQTSTVDGEVRPRRKRGNKFVFGWLAVIMLVIAGVLLGGQLFRSYDRAHQMTVSCSVISATAGTGGSTSGRGVGTIFDQVEIQTSNCGPLVIRRDIDAENKQPIAARLDQGGVREFKVGAASFQWRGLLGFFKTPVIVSEAD